jgi:hypothetical protein
MAAESTLKPQATAPAGESVTQDGKKDAATDGKKDGASTERNPRSPHFKLVEEFFRALLVAEKNSVLYPIYGKVVQESLDSFLACTKKALDSVGPLRLEVSQKDIRFEGDIVYAEENKGKSVAFRLYKDGIRDLVFFPEIERKELEDFLLCLKEARSLEDEDDDFITLFWEKNCDCIKVHMADDFIAGDDLPEIPKSGAGMLRFDRERFTIPATEKEHLKEVFEARIAQEDRGDSTFEISEEERRSILALVQKEEAYFPIFDFLDILLELMVRKPGADSFVKSVKMIRSVIDSMIQDRDFAQAAVLLSKFASDAHPSLTQRQRAELQEMAASFNDKKTLHILREFLTEHPRLAPEHPVFAFMKAFPKAAAEDFCPFLAIGNHVRAVSEVLVHLGTGRAEVFTKMLGDPDPLIVRAMIGILLRTDEEAAVTRIARALKHPDESVRLHAASTILEHGDESAGQFFLPLLSESSRQLLNVALQFFTRFTVPEAFEPLVALSASNRFHVLDKKRQEMTFKALLRAAPHQGIDYVRRRVLRWSFCLTQYSRMRKTAALNALPFCPSEHALALLARLASKKRGRLAAAAKQAMKRWQQSCGAEGDSRAARPGSQAQPSPAQPATEGSGAKPCEANVPAEVTHA